MVEQEPCARVEAVALPIVHGDVVPEDLRHAVRTAWVEGRVFVLGYLPHLAEHLARRSLVEADAGVDLPDGLETSRNALGVELPGQHRLVPRGGDERHCREVVEL